MKPLPVLAMVYGQPLSLKSSVSADISRACGWGLLSTGFFGPVAAQSGDPSFESDRNRRYEALARLCAVYIRDGWSVVVEGNFTELRWRKPVFTLSAGGVARLALIRCVCSDQRVLRLRQESRAASRWCLDHLSLPYRDKTDVQNIAAEEIPTTELPLGVDTASWVIDTGSWSIQSNMRSSDRASWLSLDLLLREWVAKRGKTVLEIKNE
jgi:predicted kinase